MQEKGIDYWQDWHNPPENYKDWIRDGFQNEEFHFAKCDNNIVGMYRLQYNDEFFWGEKNDRAGYIHSFTVRSKYHGKGVGTEILNYVEDKLSKNNIHYLRFFTIITGLWMFVGDLITISCVV